MNSDPLYQGVMDSWARDGGIRSLGRDVVCFRFWVGKPGGWSGSQGVRGMFRWNIAFRNRNFALLVILGPTPSKPH